MGRIFDREAQGLIKKGTAISKTKAGGQFTTQYYFVGLEQGTVMLEIKFQFFLHTITSDTHVPQRLRMIICQDLFGVAC